MVLLGVVLVVVDLEGLLPDVGFERGVLIRLLRSSHAECDKRRMQEEEKTKNIRQSRRAPHAASVPAPSQEERARSNETTSQS